MGAIHKLIDILDESLNRLGAQARPADLENLAALVSNVMSWQSRQFHTLDHVFGFVDGADPVTILTAVFHDLIYYQVDHGFPGEMGALLETCIEHREGKIYLKEECRGPDCPIELSRSVFGFQAGLEISPFTGLNEFLSAVVMNRLLENLLPLPSRVAVTVCIEASIPFRGNSPDGRSFLDRMKERLESLNSQRSWGLDAPRLDRILTLAAAFANEDVRDFGQEDPGRFLSNTWKLLPELNESLRSRGQYTVREYRVALQKMEGFFASLVPENVFHVWGTSPAPQVLAKMTACARSNKAVGIEYLQAKALAMAVLEALADESGGDCPLSLLTGDRTAYPGYAQQLEDYLPAVTALPQNSPVVTKLLQVGRLEESEFDLKNSPLASFLYLQMTPEEFQGAVAISKAYFRREKSSREFLEGLPKRLCQAVAQAVAQMAKTRAAALGSWVK